MRSVARRAPAVTLLVMVAAYVGVFGFLTLRQQARFGTFGFDMGIHDQGIWLLSQFREPFVTVRGLNYLGHHLNLICLLLVPAYWLGAGPSFLYLVETVGLAAGAVPVYLLGRDAFGGRWTPLIPAAAYLLYPTLNWINWWHFHPEALAIAPLLFAVWLGRRRRWGWFALACGLALSTKEDIALAVTMLGVILAVVHRRADGRRPWLPGVLTALAGAAWYVGATQYVMPAFNGGGAPFYVQEFFPAFGTSAGEVLVTILTHPGQTWSVLSEAQRLTYYWRLLAPSGLLALVGLPWLLIAGPQVGANALSSLGTTYDARFHYSVVPTAAVFAATVQGLGRLRRWRPVLFRLGLVVLVLATGATHRAWSPSPAGRTFHSGAWAGPNPRHERYRAALAEVPARASLATNYFLVPHATHRPLIYEWPNPWMPGNWGIANRDPDNPADVDYLVLDLQMDQEPGLREALVGPDKQFVAVSDGDDVLVARRVRRPGR